MSAINYQEIVSAIKAEQCVVFVGREVQQIGGKDMQDLFYQSLSDKSLAQYDEQQQLWSFRNAISRRNVLKGLSEYYHSQPIPHAPFLASLCAIPFHLIVSLLPDTSIDTYFNQFGIGQSFDYFKRERSDCPKVSKDKPLIYNLFGSIENRDYVLSHQDYHSFTEAVVSTGLPPNLKDALVRANHYLFVGIEFDKWYHILLLYLLNSIKSSTDKLAVESLDSKSINLLDENLNITLVESECVEFMENLRAEVEKQGFLRHLETEVEKLGKLLDEKRELLAFMQDEYITQTDIKTKFGMKKDIANLEAEIEQLLQKVKSL